MSSQDDASVTSVAGPSIVRERMPDIERGMVLAGRYQVEAIIGKGGSGIVLRAFDRTAQMVVAVKVLKQELVHDERWSKRFSRELRLGRPIRHPNVCRIFDIGEGDGYRFLTMELATEGTLRDLIKRNEPLRPLAVRMSDAEAAIAGLAAIHEAGIVHRDVKPDNMLRMDDGRLVISDFGLATDLPTATAVTVMVGTPHYMAPEIRAGEPATTRSDVWSLGVALYEIFFGRRPERRSSFSSEGMSKPPAPLTSTPIERAMLALAERCLSENPMERPADANAVLRLFRNAQSSPRRFARGRVPAILAITALLVGTGGVVLRRVRGAPVAEGASREVLRIEPTGDPIDLSAKASPIATVAGHVHCASMIGPDTVRLVWGSPRRAEDFDVVSGVGRPAPILPETFALGCPETSPRQASMLFTAQSPAGASEIRLSAHLDGSGATTITAGSDPVWLRNGEEFFYNIDSAHSAVFSIPTMTLRVLPDAGLKGQQTILAKAASAHQDLLAVLAFGGDSESVVAVYDGRDLRRKKSYLVSAGGEIRFDERGSSVVVSVQRSGSSATLGMVDWGNDRLVSLARHPGLDLVDGLFRSGQTVVVGRRRSKDVWLYDRTGRKRMTFDGRNFSAAVSPRGELLASKQGADGTLAIWRQSSEGVSKQLTHGPFDVEPDISVDGSLWDYVDYRRKSVAICDVRTDTCRLNNSDDMLPGGPRFSPDGKHLAYVTQINPSRLKVISVQDGATRDLGSAYWQCPPVWSSSVRLWSLEASGGHYSWSQRDVVTGQKTGEQIEIDTKSLSLYEVQCTPRNVDPDSPFFERVRVETEEQATLLRLPLGQLGH